MRRMETSVPVIHLVVIAELLIIHAVCCFGEEQRGGTHKRMEKSSWKGENGLWAQELAANKVCMCFAVSLKCLVDEIIITRFIMPSKCVWRCLGIRHTRLGVMKGVGHRVSSCRLKNLVQQYISVYATGLSSKN